MIETYQLALSMVLDPYVLGVMVAAGIYGLVIGCIPGLSASMAIALLVPVTFFMPPIPAIAAIVTTSTMAIFSGDVPGCLLRIPGTPASAAYVEESYQMNLNGQPAQALGISLFFSVIGGLIGSAILFFFSPHLANFASSFSSVEFFWLVIIGLSGAIFLGSNLPTKALSTLFLGLLISTIGMDNPSGQARFTYGTNELLSGVSLIPAMVGLFAISEVFRSVIATEKTLAVTHKIKDGIFSNISNLIKRYPFQIIRGGFLGTIIGALPGAGADIAAWMSYAISRKTSKEPEKFGTGHPEGLIEASSSNNSAVSGSWIPALVFGIPGDSITAIAIGVLYLKNLNPGPTIFIHHPENVYAIFMIFILANLLMLPLGYLLIKAAKNILKIPTKVIMPIVFIFSILGSYSINNSLFDILVMLSFGLIGYFLQKNQFPIAPIILGLVLGPMLEKNFISTILKSDGNLMGFIDRPIAIVLATIFFIILSFSLFGMIKNYQKKYFD